MHSVSFFKAVLPRQCRGRGTATATRGHGNLTEYRPILLFVLFVAESSGFGSNSLHIYEVFFMFERLMHGLCFGFMKRDMLLLAGGIHLRLLSIRGLVVVLAIEALSKRGV